MSNLAFPSNPTNGQVYTSGGKSWKWDGNVWVLLRIESQPGLSAYQVALSQGFVGTEVEWLASLRGVPGPTGEGWTTEAQDNLLWFTVAVQGRIIDQVLTEPTTPTEGAVYILAAAHPTHPNEIATFQHGAWHYRAPLSGFRFYNSTLGIFTQFSGTAWVNDVPILTDESIRDVMAAALASGTNVSVVVNDAADTITINSSGVPASVNRGTWSSGTASGSTPYKYGDTVSYSGRTFSCLVTGTLQTPVTGASDWGSFDTSFDAEAVRDTIAAMIASGSNVTLTYNDAADTLIIAAANTPYDPEAVRDTVAAMLVPGTNITLVNNDPGDTLTINATGGGAAQIPTSPRGTHLYWRLNATSTQSGGYPGLGEFQFRGVPGGAQIATGGTATASSSLFGTAASAFDGNASTEWISNGYAPQTLSYQFPTAVTVMEVSITASATHVGEAPVNFDVQYSDNGTAWTTAWSVTGTTGWTAGLVRTFTDPGLGSRAAGSLIDDLTDVDTTTVPPTNGQALIWDTAGVKWKPGTVAAGGGGGSTPVDYPSVTVVAGLRNTTFNGTTPIPIWITPQSGKPVTVIADATDGGTHVLTFGDGTSRGNGAQEYFEFTAKSDGATNKQLLVRYRVQGEPNYDGIQINVDGAQVFQQFVADSGWVDFAYDLAAGTHTIRIKYVSDGSNISGYQNLRISRLQFPVDKLNATLQHSDTVTYLGDKWLCLKAGTTMLPSEAAIYDWRKLPLSVPVTVGTDTGPVGLVSDATLIPHRYWRVYATAETGGESYTSLTNLEFREEIGVAQQATGGVASESGNAGYPCAQAFDGNDATMWISNNSFPNWISYAFATPKAIKQVLMRSRNDQYAYQTPKNFEIQWSDDNVNWTAEWAVTGAGWASSASETKLFTNAKLSATATEHYPKKLAALNDVADTAASDGQLLRWNGTLAAWTPYTLPPIAGTPVITSTKWRIYITATQANGAWVSFSTVEMRASAGGANLATGGTASANATNGGSATAAFDTDPATYWQGNGAIPSWIQYDFSTAVAVNEVLLRNGSTSAANDSPTAFDVQYWDGAAWVTLWSVTGSTGWTQGLTRTFTNPKPLTGPLIDTLADVDTVTVAPTTGQALVWDATAKLWKPGSVAAGGSGGSSSFASVGSHRYWGLLRMRTQGANINLQLLGFYDGATRKMPTSFTASSEYNGSYLAANLMDDTGSYWASSGQQAWMTVDFTTPVSISSIQVGPATGATDQAPHEGIIAYSDDGLNWTPLTVFTKKLYADTTPVAFAVPTTVPGAPAFTSTPAAYWRLLMPPGSGSYYGYRIAEVQMRGTAGGANLAIGGTAFASDYLTAPASGAFDGNSATGWQSAAFGQQYSSKNAWLGYQFASAVDINEITLQAFPTSGSGEPKQVPSRVVVQRSTDGLNWVDVWGFENDIEYTVGEVKTFTRPVVGGSGIAAVGPHRYWMLANMVGVYGGTTRAARVALRSTAGGADLAVSAHTASDQYSTAPDHASAGMFDNNPATSWANNNTADISWVIIDLGSAQTVQEIAVQALSDVTYAAQTLRMFDMLYSDDGIEWIPLMRARLPAFTTGGQIQTAIVPSTVAGGSGGSGGGSGGGTDAASLAHLYWRINIPAGNGFNAHTIAALEFRATAGGATQTTGGTPFASTVDGGAVANAFDGNAATFWGANYNSGALNLLDAFIGYQFAAPVTVAEIAITARPEGAVEASQAPTTFTVEWSDDGERFYSAWAGSFKTAYTAGQQKVSTKPSGSGGGSTTLAALTDVNVTTPPTDGQTLVWNAATSKWKPGASGAVAVPAAISARYWRIRNTTAPAGNQIAMATVQFKDATGTNIATGGTAATSSFFDSNYPADKAFDADPATRWVTAAGVGTAWLSYDFGQAKAVYTVSAAAWSGAPAAGMPNILVEYSTDNTTWTTLVTKVMTDYSVTLTQTVDVQAITNSGVTIVQTKGFVGESPATITLDAAPTPGNQLVAMVARWASAFTVAQGWTLVRNTAPASNDAFALAVRVVTGLDTATLTAPFTATGGQNLAIFEVAGAAPIVGIILDSYQDQNTASKDLNVASGADGSAIVGMTAANASSAAPTSISNVIAGTTVTAARAAGGPGVITPFTKTGVAKGTGVTITAAFAAAAVRTAGAYVLIPAGSAAAATASATATTSWSNGQSDKRHLVNVTYTGAISGVFGSTLGPVPNNGCYFGDNAGAASLLFDFGTGGKIVDGLAGYQDNLTAQGTWIIEASQDNTVWTTMQASFVWTPVNLNGVIAARTTWTNTTKYRYYRMTKTAGSTSSSPYQQWFTFRCEPLG